MLLIPLTFVLFQYYRIRYGALELNVVSQFRISSSEIATDLTADGLLR